MSNSNNNISAANETDTAGSPDWVLLHRYLENRLDAKERAHVEELLRTQAGARRTLDALREEQRLLREALEVRVEPSYRISDKVLFQLFSEERQRQQAARTNRWRRQVAIGVGIAAALTLCVFLIRPRDAAGNAEGGTVASIQTLSGERRRLTHDSRVYEGDSIFTAQGEFIRLHLFNNALLDLDENSRVQVEQGGLTPELRVESGRLGLNAIKTHHTSTITFPQGAITVPAGAWVDVWFPQSSNAVWPELFSDKAPADGTNVSAPDLSGAVVVTVLKGSITSSNTLSNKVDSTTLNAGQRMTFTPNGNTVTNVDLATTHAMEARADGSCWNMQETGPRDRAIIGLLQAPNYVELGKQLKMNIKIADAVPQALQSLQMAREAKNPAERADKLAAGQSELRRAYDLLDLTDARRPYARMVEGLAHAERGRLLADLNNGKPDDAAASVFEAASVAFEEALRPNTDDPNASKQPDSAWIQALNAPGSTQTLSDLTSADESAILASFNHALALYAQARAGDTRRAGDAATEFATLQHALGHHIEALAAQYGEALSNSLAGDHEKAVASLKVVLSVSLAGCSDTSRRIGDGIKQAALLSLVREQLAAGKIDEAKATAQDFQVLYPLEPANPALLAIQREIKAAPTK